MASPDEYTDAMNMIGNETSDVLGPAVEKIVNNMVEKNMAPRDAIGIDPAHCEALYNQAYNAYNSGQYKEAARLFHLLQLADGLEPKFAIGLAACYQMLEEYKNALTLYATVTMVDPTDPIPHYHASDCYAKMELPSAAIAELEMAVQLCGSEPQYAVIKDRSLITIKSLQGKEPHRSTDKIPPAVEAPKE